MNIHAQRLLNVAFACRESPHPELFTMSRHVHACGTPACAFGHYAARIDLQTAFELENPSFFHGLVDTCDGVCTVDGYSISYDMRPVQDHFNLCEEELEELFGEEGCGNARNAIQAAEYIEHFVAKKWPGSVLDPAYVKLKGDLNIAAAVRMLEHS